MEKKCTVVSVSPEAMLFMLCEPGRGTNFRGGLGIRVGDDIAGFAKSGIKGMLVVPLYESHWITREKNNYGQTTAQHIFELQPEINGKRKVINVRKIDFEGVDIFGLCSSEFNFLYTADRWQRLQQEVLLGYAVPALLKRLGVKPDVVWLQEGHTALTIAVMKKDPYFTGVKYLFTTHTSCPEGMEKFYGSEDWVRELGIHEDFRPLYVKDGLIDMTRGAFALSDWITAVSDEHCEVAKEIIKKMFSDDPELTDRIISRLSSIRNGSNRDLWLSPGIKAIENNLNIHNLWEAQQTDKEEFIEFIARRTGVKFNLEKPLAGLVRRIAWYKNQYPMLAPVIQAICAERREFVNTSLGRLEGLGIQVFLAGRAHESDAQCLGWMAKFEEWMSYPELAGRVVFLSEYNLELLQYGAKSLDFGINCSLPGWEACGTSDQRWAINGRINLVPRTGGAREYIEEFDPAARKGNGFFLDPYEPITIYKKLKIYSDLYYSWVERGDPCLLQFNVNAFEAGTHHNITFMMEKYKKLLAI